MNVMILGAGGREHALATAVASSPTLTHLFTMPGNAGTAALGTNIEGDPTDVAAVVRLAKKHKIGLTIVGPEAPLCAGVVDRLEAEQMRVFGPSAAAAAMEGDKAHAKKLMQRAHVPTAEARVFEHFDAARTYVATRDCALVVKAAGLAAGKGVIVCDEPAEAILALERIMLDREFADAGNAVLVEERLTGPELSVLALVSDRTICVLETARDYKRIGEGDRGPNTGGMGAVSPAPGVGPDVLARVEADIFVPIVDVMRSAGTPYRGVLYAGLMLTAAGPKVLEFNCRFGDPEAQVILPRFSGDFLALLNACVDGRLAEARIDWDPRTAVCVVMASGGYPGPYETGKPISGLASAAQMDGVTVYHAGTTTAADGADGVVTSGGRVLGVTALGDDAEAARTLAYAAAARIDFDGASYRKDIADVR